MTDTSGSTKTRLSAASRCSAARSVHAVAELLTQGSKPDELIESYPRLTCEIIRLAPVYAAVYPYGKPSPAAVA